MKGSNPDATWHCVTSQQGNSVPPVTCRHGDVTPTQHCVLLAFSLTSDAGNIFILVHCVIDLMCHIGGI